MPGLIKIDTIGKLDGHTVYAICNTCRRSTPLDTDRLIALYTAALTLDALKERLTCNRCGRRSQEIRLVYSLKSGR